MFSVAARTVRLDEHSSFTVEGKQIYGETAQEIRK
jgi:hypothetical protein